MNKEQADYCVYRYYNNIPEPDMTPEQVDEVYSRWNLYAPQRPHIANDERRRVHLAELLSRSEEHEPWRLTDVFRQEAGYRCEFTQSVAVASLVVCADKVVDYSRIGQRHRLVSSISRASRKRAFVRPTFGIQRGSGRYASYPSHPGAHVISTEMYIPFFGRHLILLTVGFPYAEVGRMLYDTDMSVIIDAGLPAEETLSIQALQIYTELR